MLTLATWLPAQALTLLPAPPLSSAAPEVPKHITAALDARIAVGFATEDRGFRLESFAETAAALAEALDYELWLEGQPVETVLDREAAPVIPRPRLVAMASWDREAQALAHDLGVDSVLVVQSASGKKGKATQKRYVPSSQMYPGAQGTAITYIGLSYRVKFELFRAVASEEEPAWERVSKWRVEEDEREAPQSVKLSAAVDGEIRLTLADVISAKSRSPLLQMMTTSAHRSVASIGEAIPEAYAELSEAQRLEFWVRATEAEPVSLAMSIDQLMELAFSEWDEKDVRSKEEEERLAELRNKKKQEGPSSPKPLKPLTTADIMKALRETLNGTQYLYGTPLLRSVQGFVHRWARDTNLVPWRGTDPKELKDLFKEHVGLEMGSHRRAHTLSFGQLDVMRSVSPRPFTPKTYIGSSVILISEDCELPNLFRDAPAPRALFFKLYRFTDEQGKEERKRKVKRFKAYSGAQLIARSGDEYEVVDKVPASKLRNEDVYRMLESASLPKWPHEGD